LRNEYFKGSSSPKDVTLIENGAKTMAVFEGFFNFLSYLTLNSKNRRKFTQFFDLKFGIIF